MSGTKRLVMLAVVMVVVSLGQIGGVDAAISTFQWNGPFSIYGYPPVPQVYGFDYWFSTEQIDQSLQGASVRVDSIRVIAPSTNLGGVINWDMEVFVHGSDIGLPEGQITGTHVDPWLGYTRIAGTQFHVVVGAELTTRSYDFDVTHDYNTNETTAQPYWIGRAMTRNGLVLDDGLHVSAFFWTGDNRNSHILFDGATIEVQTTILSQPVPEPTTFAIWGTLGGLGLIAARRKQK